MGNGLIVHGTCVAIAGRGALLRGAPGAGKSDLALRFISGYQAIGAALVSDDQVSLSCIDGRVISCPPAAIAGRMEVRGIGILDVTHVTDIWLALIVDLCPGESLERLPPDPLPCEEVLGVPVPVAMLDAFDPSASVKLKILLTGEI